MTSSTDEPRIEEMTADQPADPRPQDWATDDSCHCVCHEDGQCGMCGCGDAGDLPSVEDFPEWWGLQAQLAIVEQERGVCVARLATETARANQATNDGIEAVGMHIEAQRDLSACRAQLAAVSQAAQKLAHDYDPHTGEWDFGRWILAVLDGVPGTTQPRIEGNEADLR